MINKINNNKNNNTEKAVVYLRVSSKGQEDNYSLDAQEKLAEKYAKEHNLEIVRKWKGAESAWGKEERKNFIDMLEYSKKHPEIKHIIFDILDRMTRNDFDKLKIQKLIDDYNKTIHFTRTNKVFNKDSSPDDEFVIDIEVAVAKKMSNDISRKTKMGLDEKAEEGIYPANAPTGYINKSVNGQNIIDVDPINSPFITMLFEKVASGNYSLEMLADDLYTQGLRHKTKETKLSKSTLYRILQNPFYYGIFKWKGKMYNGKHTPLVSKELWETANQKIKEGSRPHKQKHNFAFTNLLVCNDCECSIGGELQKGKHIYYRCRHHNDIKYLTETALANKFYEIIKAVTIPKSIGNMIREGIEVIATENDTINKSRLSILNKDLSKSKTDLNKLYEQQFNDTNISDSKKQFYINKENELLSKISMLEEELTKIGNSKDIILDTNETLVDLLTNLNKLYEVSDNYEKAQIIKFILQMSKLTPNNEIIPTYRKPFDIFNEINSTLNDSSDDSEIEEDSVATTNSEQKNNIGVKADVILNNFYIDNSISFFYRSHSCIKGG